MSPRVQEASTFPICETVITVSSRGAPPDGRRGQRRPSNCRRQGPAIWVSYPGCWLLVRARQGTRLAPKDAGVLFGTSAGSNALSSSRLEDARLLRSCTCDPANSPRRQTILAVETQELGLMTHLRLFQVGSVQKGEAACCAVPQIS